MCTSSSLVFWVLIKLCNHHHYLFTCSARDCILDLLYVRQMLYHLGISQVSHMPDLVMVMVHIPGSMRQPLMLLKRYSKFDALGLLQRCSERHAIWEWNMNFLCANHMFQPIKLSLAASNYTQQAVMQN